MVTMIQAIKADDIPTELYDCLDDDFPFHYVNGIVLVYNDGNPFSEWLKEQGYKFSDKDWGWLGVWGT